MAEKPGEFSNLVQSGITEYIRQWPVLKAKTEILKFKEHDQNARPAKFHWCLGKIKPPKGTSVKGCGQSINAN